MNFQMRQLILIQDCYVPLVDDDDDDDTFI